MKNNRKLFAGLATIAVLSSMPVLASQNVKFTGEISSNTCFHSNDPNGGVYDNILAVLPTVNQAELSVTGSTAGLKIFAVYFVCPEGVPVSNPNMRLLGYNVTPSGALGNLTSVDAGGAENVSIQVFEFPNGQEPGNLLDFSNGPIDTTVSYRISDANNGSVVYEGIYGAQYYAEFGPAKSGTVRAIAERTISYQ